MKEAGRKDERFVNTRIQRAAVICGTAMSNKGLKTSVESGEHLLFSQRTYIR